MTKAFNDTVTFRPLLRAAKQEVLRDRPRLLLFIVCLNFDRANVDSFFVAIIVADDEKLINNANDEHRFSVLNTTRV